MADAKPVLEYESSPSPPVVASPVQYAVPPASDPAFGIRLIVLLVSIGFCFLPYPIGYIGIALFVIWIIMGIVYLSGKLQHRPPVVYEAIAYRPPPPTIEPPKEEDSPRVRGKPIGSYGREDRV